MNKRKGALFLALCLVLAGCGQGAGAETNVETEIAESIGIKNESAMPDTEDTDARDTVSGPQKICLAFCGKVWYDGRS